VEGWDPSICSGTGWFGDVMIWGFDDVRSAFGRDYVLREMAFYRLRCR